MMVWQNEAKFSNVVNASLGASNWKVVMQRSALFLDRDGVINVDRAYVRRLDQFEFVPGIFRMAQEMTG
jgi:hypothetical protein